MSVLTQIVNALPNIEYWVMGKMHLPKTVQDVVVHISLVFTTAFVSQLVGASIGAFNWPTFSALLAAAAAAGVSSVVAYVLNLVPSAQTKAARQKEKAKAKRSTAKAK